MYTDGLISSVYLKRIGIDIKPSASIIRNATLTICVTNHCISNCKNGGMFHKKLRMRNVMDSKVLMLNLSYGLSQVIIILWEESQSL